MRRMKAIFVMIILGVVPAFGAAQQISNTILDQQGQIQAVTQTNSSSTVPLFQITKVLLEDAIQSLQNNDTSKALIRLNLADLQISSSVQAIHLQLR